jgi:hypothetical protein
MLPTAFFTASNKKPIKCVVQITLSIKPLMFELKETQNNQGHSLNLRYISIIPLRVAVGARWTAAFFFLPYFSFIENEAALRGRRKWQQMKLLGLGEKRKSLKMEQLQHGEREREMKMASSQQYTSHFYISITSGCLS